MKDKLWLVYKLEGFMDFLIDFFYIFLEPLENNDK